MLFRLFCASLLLAVIMAGPVLAADHAHVFLYHRFGDDRYPSTNIALEDFEAHLQVLQEGRYQVLTLGELTTLILAGQPLPERCAVLTVDDVYRSFMSGALPLLQEYGYPATLFVSTAMVGGADHLTWQELSRLVDAGFEIGNHSSEHEYLLDRHPGEPPAEWRERVVSDLREAQSSFKRHLGFEPELFAYPYGEFDPVLAELVRHLGFKAAFGQQSGVIDVDSDLFTLPRFPLGASQVSRQNFVDKLNLLPLPIEVLAPSTNLLDAQPNPPVLTFRLELDGIDPASLRSYVNGRPGPDPTASLESAGIFQLVAEEPLEGRRNKYTVTASDASGRQWFWFSQLWVSPSR